MVAANYVWTNGAATGLWSGTANWDLNDGSYPGQEAGDTSTFNATSVADCDLDVDLPAGQLGNFTIADTYTGVFDFGVNDLDCDAAVSIGSGVTIAATAGAILYCAGAFTTAAVLPNTLTVYLNGTGNLSANVATNAADLTVSSTGTITAVSNQYWGKFTKNSSGVYSYGTYTHSFKDTISIGGSTDMSGTGEWTAAESLSYSSSRDGSPRLTIAAGKTITFAGTSKLSSLTGAAGTLIAGTGNIYFTGGSANIPDNFWAYVGSSVPATKFTYYMSSNVNRTTGNSISLNNVDFEILQTRGTAGLGLDGALSIGTGIVLIGYYGAVSILTTGSYALACGGISQGTLAAPTSNAKIDLGTSAITLTGTFDGSRYAVTTNPANLGHATVIGGTVKNVQVALTTEALDATQGVTDGDGPNGSAYTATTDSTTSIVKITGDVTSTFLPGLWLYNSTDGVWHTISTVSYSAPTTTVTMATTATSTWLNLSVQPFWRNQNVWFTGCNGGHQILGSGFIGSARVA